VAVEGNLTGVSAAVKVKEEECLMIKQGMGAGQLQWILKLVRWGSKLARKRSENNYEMISLQ
jgi:hypothetical protein